MNEWSRARKRIVLLIVFAALAVLIGVPSAFLFYEKPNCFDRVQNSDETGVDCGGSCQLLCRAESLPLLSKGDPRIVAVASGIYEVVALVENPNINAELVGAAYTFKLYSASSTIPTKVIEGQTFVPAGKTFAIFEGPFTLNETVPTRTTIEWKEDTLVWRKVKLNQPIFDIEAIDLSQQDSSPRLQAVIKNPSLERVSNIDIVAIISDGNGNIFAASKTYLDSLGPNESAPIVFSWPRPFALSAADIDIYIRVFPDRSFIR